MIKSMRQSTIETLGLGSVLNIFENGKLPVESSTLVDKIFGDINNRGAMVISGANGIVGAGKLMQLGVRLDPFDIPIIALDFAAAPDGIRPQYLGLVSSFGKEQADKIMSKIIRLNYDGKNLPPLLKKLNPRFLLEAIPEILEIKKSHYKVFKENFPGIEIRSVTSGFPSSELGTGISHPAFPHQINKVWEVVEKESSEITQLFWSLGLIPIPVNDNWSFVLDVLFCGLALSGLRYNQSTNMPYWKIDKYVRKYLGANPFRAHDVIGAKGANFLTWSCLNDLNEHYGSLFEPTDSLVEHKNCGQNWYPLNHLRPMINWNLDPNELDNFQTWIYGSLFQMTSIILKEKRASLAHINAIGELCAQFRNGVVAQIRSFGSEKVINLVENFQTLFPEAKNSDWYPETLEQMGNPEWQQLYVNAEHNNEVGVITIGRESYNYDVDIELNRAIDWLKSNGIEKVILSGDFHLTTQLVGADTSEFYPALNDSKAGYKISFEWSKTARRLNDEFKISVGFLNGKRCLGGMLELMIHCHYLIAVDEVSLGLPEVTLPVIPGMEMCHWSFRKSKPQDWQKLLHLLLSGKNVKAKNAVGWLIDYAGNLNDALKITWDIANNGENIMPKRLLNGDRIDNIPTDFSELPQTDNSATQAARKAILDCIVSSCKVTISEAIDIQAKHSGNFMTSKYCKQGFVGSDYQKTMNI